MLTRLAQGDDKVEAATFAFRTYAFAMLAVTLVTIAGFVPVGFAASGAGEYNFLSLCCRHHRADRILVRRRSVRPSAGGGHSETAQGGNWSDQAGSFQPTRTFLTWALRANG